MDARRLSDGKQVAIKKLSSDSNELRIAAYMSSEELRQDTRNHCVPILDVLVDQNDPTMTFIVMPLLRYIDDPDFDTVGSILDCVEELLEVNTQSPSWTYLRKLTITVGFSVPT